ncbi:MAG: hypothetical protein JXM72_08135 [Deltaproteobacteria bacterium]|nr:hypothetical protein [Deltaproteobacteria bacterium]
MILVGAGAFLALLPAWMNYDIISRDGAFQYVPAARVFLEGNFHEGFLRRELPLFPLIMAFIAKITGFDLELSGRLASYLAYVLAAIGMFKLSEVVFKNRVIALLAVLFLITNRHFVDRSIDCLKESLLICCIIWGNYLILKGIAVIDKRLIYYSLGLLTFLAGMLFRSITLVFLCAWFAVWLFHKRNGIGSRASVLLIPVLLVFVLWVFIPGMSLSWKSYHLNYFFVCQHSIMDVLRSAADVLIRFFSTGNPVLVMAGFFGLYHWKKDVYYFYSCLVLLVSFLVLVPWPLVSDRYLLAPIVWVYPLASFGIFRIFRSGFGLLKTVAVLTVFSTIVLWADIAFTPPDQDKLARKEAGQWILDNLGPGREIFTNRDRLVFYAQGTYKPLSKIKAGSTIHRVLAIDTKYEEGRIIAEEAHSRGIDPDKQFRSIYVYLHES